MVKLLVPLIVLGCVLHVSGAGQIVVSAFEKIFKYAAPAKVKTLTVNCNKAKTQVLAKKVLSAWVPKNWKTAKAKLNTSDPYSKQAYALSKGLAFVEARWDLKIYIAYMQKEAVKTKYLTAAEGKKMVSLFWAADTKCANNYTLTCDEFASEASKQIVKTPAIETMIVNYTMAFAKANSAVYEDMHFEL